MSTFDFLKNIFSKPDYQVDPIIEIPSKSAQNPVVTIIVGGKRLKMSTAQARTLWGKLGKNLELLTPDPTEYRK